jgi:hypothetical protein
MSTLVTRAGKGSPLTHNEVDANFNNLNTDKIQSGNTVAALTITALTTPSVQATSSAGLALRNSAGTTQISMGGGGGDNVTIAVATNINGANAQIDISPTGTGHVHIKPSGTGALEIAPTNVGTIDNMTIGATTARAATVTSLTSTGDGSFTGTGQVKLPSGTTGQRSGSPAAGMIRYNNSTGSFEGYTSAWGSIGGGATGAGGDTVFQENSRTVTTSYTLTSGKSASTVGPITINSGVTLTIPSGERLVIL